MAKRNALGMTGMGRSSQRDLETCYGTRVGHDKKIAPLKQSLQKNRGKKRGDGEIQREDFLKVSV